MYEKLPSFILGFHSTDKKTAMGLLNGEIEHKPSENKYDWLGPGVYFWEHNPLLAYEYAYGVAKGTQFAKAKIKDPFVIGAILDLKNCLNLTEHNSLKVVKAGYKSLEEVIQTAGKKMPQNKGANRTLDCSVIQTIYHANKKNGYEPYDSVRGAFSEGDPLYEGTVFCEKNHIQICITNHECILGYFLPKPIKKYNPDL
jgi:hypothetical protein